MAAVQLIVRLRLAVCREGMTTSRRSRPLKATSPPASTTTTASDVFVWIGNDRRSLLSFCGCRFGGGGLNFPLIKWKSDPPLARRANDFGCAVTRQHLPSGVFAPGIPNGAGDVRPCAAQRGREKREGDVRARAHAQARFTQRLCESQDAAPEGCCVSDVCIVYSVVPAHVGDCYTL